MARQAQGFDSLVAVGKETTFATAPTVANFKSIGIISSFEPEENKNSTSLRGLGDRKVKKVKEGQTETNSSMGLYLQNPRILYYALGKVTKTGAAGAYVHTITPINRCEELPSFTVQNNICVGGATFIRNYLGSKVDSLTISGSSGENIEVEVDLMHVKADDTATAASSYTTDLNEVMGFKDGTILVDGVKAATVSEFELEIANNLEAMFTMNGSADPTLINEGILDLTASLTLAFVDTTQWTKFKNNTVFELKLNFVDPTNAKNYFNITLSGARYDTNSIQSSAEDAIEQELDVIFTDISIEAGSSTIDDLTT